MSTVNANLTALSSSQVRRVHAMPVLTSGTPFFSRKCPSAMRVSCASSSAAAASHSRGRALDMAANWLTAAVDWSASDINRLVVLAQSTTKAAVPAIEQAMDEVWERESTNQRQQLLQNSSKMLRSKLAKVSTWKRDAAPARKEALKSDLETLRSLLKPRATATVGTSPILVPSRSRQETVERLNETLGAESSKDNIMARGSLASPAARCEWPRDSSTVSLLSSLSETSPRCLWPRGMQSGFSAPLVAPRCKWPRTGGPEHLTTAPAFPRCSWPKEGASLTRSVSTSSVASGACEMSMDRQMNALGALSTYDSAFQETRSEDGPRCPWPRTGKTSSRMQPTKAMSRQEMGAITENAAACPWPRELSRVRSLVGDGTASEYDEESTFGPRCPWPRKQ